jgi:hypothetical protein
MGAGSRGRQAGDADELDESITTAYADGDGTMQSVLEALSVFDIHHNLSILRGYLDVVPLTGMSIAESREIEELVDDLMDSLKCFLETGEYYPGARANRADQLREEADFQAEKLWDETIAQVEVLAEGEIELEQPKPTTIFVLTYDVVGEDELLGFFSTRALAWKFAEDCAQEDWESEQEYGTDETFEEFMIDWRRAVVHECALDQCFKPYKSGDPDRNLSLRLRDQDWGNAKETTYESFKNS